LTFYALQFLLKDLLLKCESGRASCRVPILFPSRLPNNAQRPRGNTSLETSPRNKLCTDDIDHGNINRWKISGGMVVIETRPSRAIRSDITTNVYGRWSAARTRNVTAAHDHEMAAAHPSDTSSRCFVEPRRHSRYLHITSVQSSCHPQRPEERAAPCKVFSTETATCRHIDNCVSARRQATCPHAVWDARCAPPRRTESTSFSHSSTTSLET